MLRCPVWAYPQVTVTWLRDDLPLNLVTHRYTLYQDSREAQLTITNVQREQHQRWYSCVARSAEFGERTKTFQLLVEGQGEARARLRCTNRYSSVCALVDVMQ